MGLISRVLTLVTIATTLGVIAIPFPNGEQEPRDTLEYRRRSYVDDKAAGLETLELAQVYEYEDKADEIPKTALVNVAFKIKNEYGLCLTANARHIGDLGTAPCNSKRGMNVWMFEEGEEEENRYALKLVDDREMQYDAQFDIRLRNDRTDTSWCAYFEDGDHFGVEECSKRFMSEGQKFIVIPVVNEEGSNSDLTRVVNIRLVNERDYEIRQLQEIVEDDEQGDLPEGKTQQQTVNKSFDTDYCVYSDSTHAELTRRFGVMLCTAPLASQPVMWYLNAV
eukprot:CFRG6902T1